MRRRGRRTRRGLRDAIATIDETGDVEKVIVTNIGSFSKDGAVKNFSPPRSFATFDLIEALFFPAFYFVTLVVAEVDMGSCRSS